MLETMIAMTLFAVGTVAIMELMQRAQAGASDGESVLIATQLAQKRMEELRNVAYASLADESAALASPFGRFTRAVDVTPLYSDTLREIDVTVSWNAPGGTADVNLRTYRSDTAE